MHTDSTQRIERYLAYAHGHRRVVKAGAGLLIFVIAWADWLIGEGTSIGFLYIVPVLLISGLLGAVQILFLSAACSFLRELFHPLAWQAGHWLRLITGFGGFVLVGFFVSELERNRRLIAAHLHEARKQTSLRQQVEQQLRVLIETSPLAILTIDGDARVVIANQSANDLLGFNGETLAGQDIRPCLPILERLLRAPRAGSDFRTTVECKGQRRNGEVFLAHLWLSTYGTPEGPALAAVVWDASENLRDREGTGLDSMMETSRILIGAFSHEIRNLSAAASRTHTVLGAAPGLAASAEYQTMAALLNGLERLASSGLHLASSRAAAVADLGTVLDEARIVIEPSVKEIGGTLEWRIPSDLPRVRGDHQSLLQVFLNLARNSEHALTDSPEKRLSVEAAMERDLVVVRFHDSGPGVAHPDELFRPFQSGGRSAGLGLYVSRAILRSHGGDLSYAGQGPGACFVVELWPAEEAYA